jgi:hypothetical protein
MAIRSPSGDRFQLDATSVPLARERMVRNPPRAMRWPRASRPKGGRSTQRRHPMGSRLRVSPSTPGLHVDERPRAAPMPQLPTARRDAVGGRARTAPFCVDAEGPQRDFDLTSGPGGPAGLQRQDGIRRRLLGNGRRVRRVNPAWRGQRTATNRNGRRPSCTAWGARSPKAAGAVVGRTGADPKRSVDAPERRRSMPQIQTVNATIQPRRVRAEDLMS